MPEPETTWNKDCSRLPRLPYRRVSVSGFSVISTWTFASVATHQGTELIPGLDPFTPMPSVGQQPTKVL
jgi:hypothetical protein